MKRVVSAGLAIASFVLLSACGDEAPEPSLRASGLADAEEVHFEYDDCADLAADPAFGKDAGTLRLQASGTSDSCSVTVRADSPVIGDAGLRVIGCPPEASVSLPFARDGDGWTLDVDGLGQVDNGSCFQAPDERGD